MSLYNKKVIKHFTNPHNVGIIQNTDCIGEVGSHSCNDIVKIYLKIKDDIIIDSKFETFGCVTAIASSSIATDLIINKKISEALSITNKDIVNALGGLPEGKEKCSKLVEEAIKLAIENYSNKDIHCVN